MKHRILAIFIGSCAPGILALLGGCGGAALAEGGVPAESAPQETLRIVNWNVQTFFDSVTSGGEYAEFIKSTTWNQQAYEERLRRLVAVIRRLDADVFVMEELEHEGVLLDISNFLAGEWNAKKQYAYGCFAKDAGSAIGCGVLSRFPLKDLTVHELDVRTEQAAMPRMRPLMEVTVSKGRRELVLFVNHWKSKSGGAEASEPWRNRQEALLGKAVASRLRQNRAILACGDFNRDLLEFRQGSSADTVLLRQYQNGALLETGTEVLSLWYDAALELVEPGSYFYQDAWSRIDNFFAAGPVEVVDFAPQTGGDWCDGQTQVPVRYTLWNGKGYSDHLPIACTVQF